MVDPALILTSVRHKHFPTDWRVFPGRGKGGCMLATSLFLLVVGIGLAAMLAILITGVVGLFSGLGMVLIIILPIGILLRRLLPRLARSRSLLVLLPEGVVEYPSGKPNRINSLPFDTIQRMDMDKQTMTGGSSGIVLSATTYWLNVYGYHGEYLKWDIDDCYGDPILLGGNILAAYQYYQQQSLQRS